jgi:hypothetical protein
LSLDFWEEELIRLKFSKPGRALDLKGNDEFYDRIDSIAKSLDPGTILYYIFAFRDILADVTGLYDVDGFGGQRRAILAFQRALRTLEGSLLRFQGGYYSSLINKCVNVDTDSVFISYATEGSTFPRALAELLRSVGYHPMIDNREIELGDDLHSKISQMICASTYLVVVVSPAYIGKRWTMMEYEMMVSEHQNHDKPLIPIWNGINRNDTAKCLPDLAEIRGLDASGGLHQFAIAFGRLGRPQS